MSSETSVEPATILVVNDREDQLFTTVTILERLGHRLVTAMSGEEALRQLLQGDFAAVLLDVNMPGMDGFEIAAAVRSRPRLESLPIIFLTATNQGTSDHLRGYETGAVDYVHVPVDPSILRAKVSAFVRMHRMNAQIRRQAEDLARLNQELHEQTRQLTAVNGDLEAFSYSVSHDLRAPLRIIDQYGAILEREQGGALSDDGRKLLGRIRFNAAHMGELIEALIELSRVNRSSIALGEVDLGVLAQSAVDNLRQQEADREVTVAIQPGMRVRADPGMVRTLLANLVGNAWKYTARQAAAHIEVSCIATVHHPRTFRIKDNGVGFDMAYANKLFAPFQRLHAADDFAGSGIGLSIVARIVTRHGGKVWVEAAVGQGASFYFTLEP